MAENDQQQQERTEQATPKRLEEARKRGQIARSRELNMAAVMIIGALALYAGQPRFGNFFIDLMTRGLSFDTHWLRGPEMITAALSQAALAALTAFSPFLAAAAVAAVLGGVAVGGWAFSAKPMVPNLGKLDPIKGLKRVFGLRGLVETGKAVAKAAVVGGCALGFIAYASTSIFNLSLAPLGSAMSGAGTMISLTLLICSMSLILVALIDVPFQIWNHNKQLRMTRKEVEDELKETEGRPEVRSRIRSLQQELSDRRMLDDVAEADVVVTNPTHFAVALKYDEGQSGAPIVLAKGMDYLAERIREIAEENGIAFFEAPPLARALYWTTDVGKEIPAQLYLAVAQVLTYVYRLKAAMEQADAEWPERPEIEVDEALTERPKIGRQDDVDE
jgi:flagellar biosynthetic protein FlhB